MERIKKASDGPGGVTLHKSMTRRAGIAAVLGGLLIRVAGSRAIAAPLQSVRLGTLKFGTVQWVADVIQRHRLDAAHGFALEQVMLANTDAGRVAMMAGSADIVVSDWLFAASQRAAGTKLCFAPFSNATGGVMARQDAPIHALADLKGKRLGVAGGPLDKSWIIVQAAARASAGIDLPNAAQVVYGAPPLLNAKLGQGELDGVLTYWNFAARLEAEGARQVISVDDCVRQLGLPGKLDLVGFVFHEDWANANRAAIDGFLDAAAAAQDLLRTSDAEWNAVRPLMQAPDDALFASLKRRFIAGIPHETSAEETASAARVLQILRQTGGARAAAGLAALPPGLFWPTDRG